MNCNAQLRPAALLLLACSAATMAASGTYSEEVDKWRGDFDADVRHGGWLTLVNRVELPDGAVTVGSDSMAIVGLPARAPKNLGRIARTGSTVYFQVAPGVPCLLDGKAVQGTVALSTKSGQGRIQTGAIRVAVRTVGDDFYALVTDDENPAIARFKGTSWFPVDPSWRISAQFLPYAQPESVGVPMTHVTSKTIMQSTGDVVFELRGQQTHLKTFLDEGHLFVMFADPTNGRDTYGGGRFLKAPLPKDGTAILDFNKAFNPYCSVNSNVMCPVVPSDNRLTVPVVAGEKYTGAD